MKIALCSYYNPHFVNTTVYRYKAIEALGHQPVMVPDRPYALPGRLRRRWPALQAWDLRRINQQFLRISQKERPDLWITVGGDTMLPATVQAIRELGIPTALWTTNVPLDFKIVCEAAIHYDHVFCAGTEAMDFLCAHGVKTTHWLPYGCDPAYHHPVTLTDEEYQRYHRSVAFVGSHYPNREALLKTISDLDIGIWGPYWDRLDTHSPLKKKARPGKINFNVWTKIYSAADITVVVHYQDGHTPSYQASPKLFEAMACRAFVLCDRQKDAVTLFHHEGCVDFFDSPEELRDKIRHYTRHPALRQDMAKKAQALVTGKHTFKQRMARLIDTALGRN